MPAYHDTDTTSKTKTTDLYARGTLKFAGSNSLVVGLRYNYDQIAYSYLKRFFPPFLPSLTDSDSSNDSLSWATSACSTSTATARWCT
ncbi:MAG: hypothetical protein U1F30_15045 [Steroidobacteraceae bacterium]